MTTDRIATLIVVLPQVPDSEKLHNIQRNKMETRLCFRSENKRAWQAILNWSERSHEQCQTL